MQRQKKHIVRFQVRLTINRLDNKSNRIKKDYLASYSDLHLQLRLAPLSLPETTGALTHPESC